MYAKIKLEWTEHTELDVNYCNLQLNGICIISIKKLVTGSKWSIYADNTLSTLLCNIKYDTYRNLNKLKMQLEFLVANWLNV